MRQTPARRINLSIHTHTHTLEPHTETDRRGRHDRSRDFCCFCLCCLLLLFTGIVHASDGQTVCLLHLSVSFVIQHDRSYVRNTTVVAIIVRVVVKRQWSKTQGVGDAAPATFLHRLFSAVHVQRKITETCPKITETCPL